ncbi:hypothetical protein SAMN04487819_11687 [Actinopolyspora alba]|uniref:Uncharacterized protein n=1 Tax=Actinopolyspora alba TaxID=673379 RepID=A0A1I2BG18_9ACTN|nr:hypothetical protein [Actinopolyspora alba]SFE55111.1 hypothetical protein SAMN04487819_11687 [Actinopolyspora alba]
MLGEFDGQGAATTTLIGDTTTPVQRAAAARFVASRAADAADLTRLLSMLDLTAAEAVTTERGTR